MPEEKENFTWNFQRMGGLDQVSLRTTEELNHFSELDPKLWVALSCPKAGLCFSEKTLAFLDDDNDGRIRFQEIQEAVKWTAARLVDPAVLSERRSDLPLDRIRQDTEEGQRLLGAAHRILLARNREDAESLEQEDLSAAVQNSMKATFNGDGVLIDRPELDDDLRAFIRDIINTLGGVQDASGEQGADIALAQKFMEESKALLDWHKQLDEFKQSSKIDNIDQAYSAYNAVASKIDDYFIRCRLVAYEQGCANAINAPVDVLAKLSTEQLDIHQKDMADLPLAHVAPKQPLPLIASQLYPGINPAWRDAIKTFRDLVFRPLFVDHQQALPEETWEEIKSRFASYAAFIAKKGTTATESLGLERLEELQKSDILTKFSEVAKKDLAGKEEIDAISDVERLVLFHANLFQLLMNFVSFHDFYALSSSTTFQVGTLYLDGKSCHLCLAVNDVEQHAALAKQSQLCLVYCECTHEGASAPRKIVAALTAGTANLILPGRHGVFIDNTGEEWDATVLKLVDNPIDLRAAVFSPYHKMARLISEQIIKRTMAKNDKVVAGTQASLGKLALPAPAPAPTPVAAPVAKMPFDIGRSVGIFAAIGLALGALGTAVATIARAVLSLSWWQFPILLLGIFLVISGPSVFMAWLKLRKRTLGPVLDASGWAVNSQIPINLTMGSVLTKSASLPSNAQTTHDDPFYEAPPAWYAWTKGIIFLIIAALLIGGIYWVGWTEHGQKTLQGWQQIVQETEKAATAPAATPPAATSAQ